MQSLPVIDISKLNPLSGEKSFLTTQDGIEVARQFKAALREHGFLYLLGHGIDENLIKESFIASSKVFDNCLLLHRTFRRKKGLLLGYVDGKNEKDLPDRPEDLKQAYDMVIASKEFQSMPTTIKHPLRQLFQTFQLLSTFVLRLLAVGLNHEDIDYFVRAHAHLGKIEENSSTLRMLHYPAVKNGVEENQSRISEHTDFGTFTMLLQDTIGGLEAQSPEGAFIPVRPLENSIVLNVGDLLQLWSNFQLRSTLHRVVVPTCSKKLKCARYSIAFFSNPDDSFEIDAIDSNGNRARKSVKQHIEERNNTTILEVSGRKMSIKLY